MIKTVIFDVDGVLNISDRFTVNLQRHHGINQEVTLPFFNGEFQQYLIGKGDLKEGLTRHIKNWGWKGTVDELIEFWFSNEHKLDQELLSYIKDLQKKHIQCYIATNQEKYRTEYIKGQMGLGKLFVDIFSSAEVGHLKTDINFFEKIMKNLSNIKKEEIVFWDDSIGNIETAKKFGIHAELYTNLEDFKKKMKLYLTA